MQLDCIVDELLPLLRQIATTKFSSKLHFRFSKSWRLTFGLLLSLSALSFLPVSECGCRAQKSAPCQSICITNHTTNSTSCVIRALVLLPLSDVYEASLRRVLPILRLAEEKIHEIQLISPSIRFEWIPQDDRCDASHALINAMDGILKNCSHVIFGPSCEYSLASVGRITKYFNGEGTPLISVGGATYDFEKKKTSCSDEFYMLLRTGIVSFQSLANLTVQVMSQYHWETAVFLYERNGHMNVVGMDTCYLMMKSLAKEFRLENKTYSQYLLDSSSMVNLTADMEREIGNQRSRSSGFSIITKQHLYDIMRENEGKDIDEKLDYVENYLLSKASCTGDRLNDFKLKIQRLRLLLTSDPLVSSLRPVQIKKTPQFRKEALEMLISEPPVSFVDADIEKALSPSETEAESNKESLDEEDSWTESSE